MADEISNEEVLAPAEVEQEIPNLENPMESLGMDEELWIGGPTKAQVEDFKKEHPNCQIRVAFTTDEGGGIIWRTVTRSEWRELSKVIPTLDSEDKREEFTFSKIVLFPKLDQDTMDKLPAGIISAVLQEFYLHCGFQMVAPSLKL